MSSFLALIKSWWNKLIALFTRKADPLEPIDDPGEVVCYYGCPNSNKAKKLQLGKTTYR